MILSQVMIVLAHLHEHDCPGNAVTPRPPVGFAQPAGTPIAIIAARAGSSPDRSVPSPATTAGPPAAPRGRRGLNARTGAGPHRNNRRRKARRSATAQRRFRPLLPNVAVPHIEAGRGRI